MLYKLLLRIDKSTVITGWSRRPGVLARPATASVQRDDQTGRRCKPRHVGVNCHKVATLRPFVASATRRVAQEANNG
jgi:hypothetical protein